MKYFRRLSGPRVYLSPVNPEDYELYTRWLNDPEIAVPLGSMPPVSLPGEKEFLEKMARDPYSFAIIRGEDDQLLGNCSLFDIDPKHRRATCGLFIGERANLSQGYGSEALALLLSYGFDQLNLGNIMLIVAAFNGRGIRAYQKVGFREVGRRRSAWFAKGQYHDEVFMDILPEELNRGLISPPVEEKA